MSVRSIQTNNPGEKLASVFVLIDESADPAAIRAAIIALAKDPIFKEHNPGLADGWDENAESYFRGEYQGGMAAMRMIEACLDDKQGPICLSDEVNAVRRRIRQNARDAKLWAEAAPFLAVHGWRTVTTTPVTSCFSPEPVGELRQTEFHHDEHHPLRPAEH